jgi:hypothetical protein
VVLDDLVPAAHVCRVLDAFVDRLEMESLASGSVQTILSKLPPAERITLNPASSTGAAPIGT